MPIPVSCQCGASFQAPDKLAGQVTSCPKCQAQLPIPGPQAHSGITDLLDELGVDASSGIAGKCPHCYADLQPDSVICTGCGTNLQTGASVIQKKRKRFQTEAPDDGPSLGDARLDKAARELAKDAADSRKSSDPVTWWVYLAILDLVLSLCVTAAVMMMTHDDVKSRRMDMVNSPAHGIALYQTNPKNIVLIATATDGYTHEPPYGEEEKGSQLRAGAWGRRAESRGGYTVVDVQQGTGAKTVWVNSNAILNVSPSIIKHYADNPQLGAVKSLKYGLYKGLRIGLILLAFLSAVITVIALGQIILSAFQDDITQGLLCLTIGYAPYYALMRWYKLQNVFKMFVFGTIFLVAAIVSRLFVPALLPLVRGTMIE